MARGMAAPAVGMLGISKKRSQPRHAEQLAGTALADQAQP
jgi:hypothetical protein